MLTLLAESKTMASYQQVVDQETYAKNTPLLENLADNLENYISSLSPLQISEILGISNQLAIKAHTLAYDFPHKATGYKAIFAFIGDAYKGFDIKTMSEKDIDRTQDQLRIISSVYGIIRPFDIIKPYRNEFNKEICQNGKTPIQLFKPKVTIEIANFIKENKVNDIINLLPSDADKCVDWKIIRSFVPVHKIVFQTFTDSGKLKTPIAKRLKELRGLMAREIIQNGINTFKELTEYQSDNFIFSPEYSRPLLPVFIV